MGSGWQLDRLADDLARLGRRGLPRDVFFREAGARLRRSVAADAMCWHTLDPQTQLLTSDAPEELVAGGVFTPETAAEAGTRIVASEYLVDDVNTFASIAARRAPAAVLSRSTNGRPERSVRYRELLAPAGIPHELRAAFVSRGRCWGALHMARREDRPDFSADDAAALARLSSVIADGIRTSLRFDAARRPEERGAPGLVVIGPSGDVELVTAPAQELLAGMRSAAVAEGSLPSAVIALAAYARRDPEAGERALDAVVVPSGSGWVTLHASLPDGPGGGRVAIVLDRAAGPAAAAVQLEAHGVTAREREIASLLAGGLTYAEIADALVLSPYTVQDHVKSLFEKVGVASRQELVARVFLDEYLPRIARRDEPGSDGRFAAR